MGMTLNCVQCLASLDAALAWVCRFGQGALLAKRDIEVAFWMLPVHLDSFCLLGVFWDGGIYVDCYLPPGSRICFILLHTLELVAWQFGVPLAPR